MRIDGNDHELGGWIFDDDERLAEIRFGFVPEHHLVCVSQECVVRLAEFLLAKPVVLSGFSIDTEARKRKTILHAENRKISLAGVQIETQRHSGQGKNNIPSHRLKRLFPGCTATACNRRIETWGKMRPNHLLYSFSLDFPFSHSPYLMLQKSTFQ